MADGATVSFDPGPWAEMLVAGFIERRELTVPWLSDAVRQYTAGYDRDSMEWMQQGAFDKGSFATLLGLVLKADGTGIVTAIGDSLLAVLDGSGTLVETLPYTLPEQFDLSPRLLSTNDGENAWLSELPPTDLVRQIDLRPHADRIVLMMTDALGHWLLNHPLRAMELTQFDEAGFKTFVEEERAAHRLRRDDTTLVVAGMVA